MSLENEWETVEEFLSDLKRTIQEEEAAIRETELDFVGEYADVTLHFGVGINETTRVFFDKLNRIVLPGDEKYGNVETVCVHNGMSRVERPIAKREPRYQGNRLVSWVYYLGA